MTICGNRVDLVDASQFSAQELQMFVKDQNLSRDSNLYTNPIYLAMWNKYIRDEKSKLFFYRVYKDNKIIGLVPIQYQSNFLLKKFSSPGVMFGYPDFISTSENRDAVLDAFLFHLKETYRFYSADLFRSKNNISIRENLKFSRVYEKKDSPYIELDNDIRPISARLAGNIQYNSRRLQSNGVKVEHYLVSTETDNIDTLLRQIADLHAQNWPGSIFKRVKQNYFGFIQNLVMNKLENLQPVISTITVKEEIAAAHLGFFSESTFYYWLPVINTKFSKFSPGQILIKELLIFAKERNLQVFDFMNDLEPYKLKWTDTIGSRFGIEICSHSILQSKYKKYFSTSTLKYLLSARKLTKLLRHPKRTISKFVKT